MAKHMSKKKKTKSRKLVIQEESSGDKVILETPEATLTKEISSPEKTTVIPPEVSLAKSFHYKVLLLSFPLKMSPVPMFHYHHISFSIHLSLLHALSLNSLINHSLHYFLPNPLIHLNRMSHPRLLKNLKMKIHDVVVLSQILNLTSSSFEIEGLLKIFEARMVSKVSGMIKDSESRLLEKVDHSDQNNELRVNSQNSKFVGAVKELKQVAKERHTLFSLDVKKVTEDVNFKLQ
ncbi:unnamed protein product [Lactuca saligna]|uniref:Uncharacterized protein n=1 Tax=Lactuca saligna TaxID=75948 RepID=A0AA35USM9_LACSI|nr:unnamed protein product [Lactuca saligna]